jgi:hypothetical protein
MINLQIHAQEWPNVQLIEQAHRLNVNLNIIFLYILNTLPSILIFTYFVTY